MLTGEFRPRDPSSEYWTTAQNVMMPMTGGGRADRARRARDLLDMLGVAHVAGQRPAAMSGVELQRTAIAVALASTPAVLLADEPTGELDTATAADVFAALSAVNAELGVTMLIVTHDPAVAGFVARTIAIRDGRTSAEAWRHVTADEREHTTEYAVLDRAGRLQLPREMTEPLGMRDLVRL